MTTLTWPHHLGELPHDHHCPPAGSRRAASATGRVEPKNGEVRISSAVPGRIVDVVAKTNDQVTTGDLLVELDSDDLIPKLDAAESEAEESDAADSPK